MIRRWSRKHPFLLVGFGSFLFFLPLLLADLPPESPHFRFLVTLWHLLGFGPHLAANLLARYMPGIGARLDAILVVVLGLLPYVAADAVLARVWARRERGRAPVA